MPSGSASTGSRPACARDLFRRIAKGTEHPIVQAGPRGVHEAVGIEVLPDDLAGARHLEDPSIASFADQRVSVGQALRAPDVRAEEVEERLIAVLPDYRARSRVDFDDARKRRDMIPAVRAVVKDRQIDIGEGWGGVLLREWRTAKLPTNTSARPFDDRHRGDVSEARHEPSIGHLGHRVAVRPLFAAVLERDDLCRDVEVLPASPFPDDFAARSHLEE